MSRIEKLSISGLRSFGPLQRETIAFGTPLTLIVGYNGSGKTTIIECLKYACTGELPPNSKGGAFIHDPALVGEHEVLAQVKMIFRSNVISRSTSQGENFIVTRNVQLSVKKARRAMKTLDGTLVKKNDDGERVTVAARVAELDSLIPFKLGVSPAILDTVIFCHQDESLWPMSEPLALKKRFDDIFEAGRYTKAVDMLRLQRKKQGDELRVLKVLAAQTQDTKNKADKCRAIMDKKIRETAEYRDQIEELEDLINREDEVIRAKHEQANTHLDIVHNLRNKLDQLRFKKQTIDELHSSIKELPQSDDSLAQNLAQYEEQESRTIQERDLKADEVKGLEKSLGETRRKHAAKLAEKGRFQSDQDKYERQLANRVKMVHDAADRYEVRGYDGLLDDSQVADFRSRMQKMLADKRQELDRLQKQNAAETDEKSATITEWETKKASRTQDRTSAEARRKQTSKEMALLQHEIGSLDVDEGSKVVLETQLQDLEARIAKARDDDQAADLDSHIQKETNLVRQLQAEEGGLNQELLECTRQASERAQIEVQKKHWNERRKELDILKSTWNKDLSDCLGPAWTLEKLDSDFQAAFARQKDLAESCRKEKESTEQKLKQLQYELSTARTSEGKKKAERESCRAAVVKALHAVSCEDSDDVDRYQSELDGFVADLKGIETDLKMFDYMFEHYDKIYKAAVDDNKCRLCDRGFHHNDPAKAVVTKKALRYVSAEGKKQAMKDQEEFTAHVQILEAVRSKYDTYVRLDKTELPPLARDIASLEMRKKEELVPLLESQDAEFHQQEGKRQEMEALSRSVGKITQAVKDIAKLAEQVERSQQASYGTSRSVDEIREQQEECSRNLRSAEARLNTLNGEKQHKKDLFANLNLERSELQTRMSESARALERKRNKEQELEGKKAELARLTDDVQQAKKDLESIGPEIDKARAALNEVRQRGRVKEQKVMEERDAIVATIAELKRTDDEIQDYLNRGGPANLESTRRALDSLEKAMSNLEEQMAGLTKEVNRLRKEVDSGETRKRNIKDNIKYRQHKRESDVLRREIRELEARNAQEDYDRLMGEVKVGTDRRTVLVAKKEKTAKDMAMCDGDLARLTEMWETEYATAAEQAREAQIKKHTTEAAVDDLGRYAAALEKAIMQYHSLKMAEINRITAELWQATYQGTDIDTISIRSDAEVSSSSSANNKNNSSSTATTRRNYNYRVVMVKGDTEMDMRGRCSAGQKVLASIIIRLALAESFGVACGLIALDEPTTNLDSDNVRSLAESIHNIINARRAQPNLQIIVITHDEEFLRAMRCGDFCDDFYRVRRDEKQNSVIVRETITRIMEG